MSPLKPPVVLDRPGQMAKVLSKLVDSQGNQQVRTQPSLHWLVTRMGMTEEQARKVLGIG